MVNMEKKVSSARKCGGKYCVDGAPNNVSCTNTSYTEGISMHAFSTNAERRGKWVSFVKTSKDFTLDSVKYKHLNNQVRGLPGRIFCPSSFTIQTKRSEVCTKDRGRNILHDRPSKTTLLRFISNGASL